MKHKASAQSLEREYKKAYIKLLTKAAANTAKQVDAYFFGEEGEDGELRAWYYGTTAFSIAMALSVYVMM
ncbi:hypothetical protein [Lysinibacillus fusiformis]|uniref:hypothetical protein n=1 Tax=Lysinibacillus fusiformis TaxID=28031 RepID=UPI000D3B4F37|nr:MULTISPECIES: hypothetical protein [Lysinibacillus]MED4672111.1 hypothetical protein [Lysinibacillus fusiformis]QAS57426.1 hypothetical protein LSP_14250 [Lysinibacillus sphaericus]RDV26977.1 hypothetical protein C7B90_19960 [Lysinibacillus fusiformis]GED65144.1 hypothetical protein LFU01_35960 [Lysinibacillus fusiformis]